MSKSHLHRFICDDLLTLFVSRRVLRHTSVIEKASPKTTSSASNTCDENQTKEKEKKDILFVVKGSLHYTPKHTYHTLTLYTHSCTHHFVKLHISKQVPLFISALTEPHTQIESTVTAYPYLLFHFFLSFG